MPLNIENSIKLALEETIEGIQIISLDWRYIYLNRAAIRHARKKKEELIGKTMMECYPGIEHAPFFKDIEQVRTTKISRMLENQFEFEDGQKCWFELYIEPFQQGILIRSIDITEKKKLEQDLRHSQKLEAVGRLAGGVAHDFNNKLSIMLIFCELAAARLKDGDPILADYINKIFEAVSQSASLTKQLLAFSRKQVLDIRVVDLNQILSTLIPSLSKLIGERIDIEYFMASNLYSVKVDPSQIDQVILNLCVNARDAMPNGGKLTIETCNIELDEKYSKTHPEVEPGHYVMIAFTDTGCGMTMDVQSRIFEPFFTTKGKDQGTGLGLSMVHGIVKQCRGHIWVYSEPNIGTVFKVYFPAIMEKAEILSAVKMSSTGFGGDETILLVEDDPVLQLAYASSLREAGYRVISTSEPKEALKHAADEKVDLLLTDLILPQMSGYQLAQKLIETRPELRVIYMSGYTENTIVHQGVLDTDSILLQKPISIRTMLETIRIVLEGKIKKGVF